MKYGRKLLALAAGAALTLSFVLTGCTAQTAPISSAGMDTQNTPTPAQSEEPAVPGVVKTTAGLVQGTEQDGVLRYLGVPYAQAAERFVPAGEVEPWDGVRLMDSYGNISPQGALFGMGMGQEMPGTDNNCQNLNLWTPGADNEKRPVMVWLHGGGFSTGSGNEEGYDGANLSRSGDVVVVAVNHRLNLFGHLDLSEYGEKYQYSGNVGVMDIIAALEWIQDNIAAFGGDPDNVTVFGQSGGGAKVLALMTSPYAKGLFHKGIVQSGATETLGVTFASKEASASLTQRILDSLDITADNIEDIQTIPEARLQEAATAALQATAEEYEIPAALGEGYSMEWGPVVEGDFLPTNPVTEESFAAAGADIPLLIGSTLNEWNFLPGQGGETSDEIQEAIRAAYPNKPERRPGGYPHPPAHAEDHVPQGGPGWSQCVRLHFRPGQLLPRRGDSLCVPQHG